MIMFDAGLFFGRFHPLVVHLPIGFLLIAALLEIAGRTTKYNMLRSAVPVTLLFGSASAVIACISGYLLSLKGEYNSQTLESHLTYGIVTAVISFVTYILSRNQRFPFVQKSMIVSVVTMLVLVTVTGHLGGTLTHGSGYLTTDIIFTKKKQKNRNVTKEDEMIAEDSSVTRGVPVLKDELVKKLIDNGFAIKYIHIAPALLDVTLPSSKANADAGKVSELLAVKDNILWLNLAGTKITDKEMETVSQFKNLRRLRLDNNPVSDAGVAKLKGLENLQSINLHNTGITKNCINDLSNMKSLKRVYVWGTSIRQEDMAAVTGSLKIIANP
jgi:uncharacterized membrane protein